MTTASRILDEYSRDWNIDQTPNVGTTGIGLTALGYVSQHQVVREPLTESIGAGAEFPTWRILVHADETIISTPLLVESNARMNWTSAYIEAWDRIAQATRAAAAWFKHDSETKHFESKRPKAMHWVGPLESTLEVSFERDASPRAHRALSAVEDISRWLALTATQAADLLGYRRSYYNWIKGVQPYPATTLNLYEAHAFIEALVDALGDRGARVWLDQGIAGSKRTGLLRTKSGRDELRGLSNHLIFPTQTGAEWSPDFELEHKPAATPDDVDDYFGAPIEIDESGE